MERGWLRALLRRVGVDRAVAWVILGRTWAILAGPVTIFLIGTRLAAAEQGYYYTFASILSMAMFFELGLGGWITRFAGYEFAKLRWNDEGKLEGDAYALQRLSSLVRFALRWYVGAAGLFVAIVLPVGILFFRSKSEGAAVAWALPWLLMVLVSFLNMFLSPFFSLLEGCGMIAQMARLQFLRTVAGNLAVWIALLAGLGLLCAPILSGVGLLLSLQYLLVRRNVLTSVIQINTPQNGTLHWRTELLPLQWRTAVTVVAGYLTWQTANPILFSLAGPEAAGRLGMSINLLTMIQSFGLAWINTKIPRMSTLLSAGDKGGLRALFRASAVQAMLVVGLGGLTLVTTVYVIGRVGHPLATRLLSPLQLGVLLVGSIASTAQIALITYVRTYKQEPFVLPMIVMGATMPAACYLLGRLWGMPGLLFSMTAINTILGLGWTVLIAQSKLRKVAKE